MLLVLKATVGDFGAISHVLLVADEIIHGYSKQRVLCTDTDAGPPLLYFLSSLHTRGSFGDG